MDEQERYDMIVKIADQLEWLGVHHESFSDQELGGKIVGLLNLLDKVDPTQMVSMHNSRIGRVIQQRGLKIRI
jgi:hypothetical protein